MSEERLLTALGNDLIARQSLSPKQREILQRRDDLVDERTRKLGPSATYEEKTRVLEDVQSMIPGSRDVVEKYKAIFSELESAGSDE